ncbi:MAG: lactonase family protein [Acidobacteria bacterium]|nr:lactonase family protein [Acidobacteriota bacterium]
MAFLKPALGLALAAMTAASAVAAEKGAYYFYVGTYTGKSSKGIYQYKFDPATAKVESLGLVAETPNPTFLVVHPSHKYLYAANEVGRFNGQRTGSVTAFRMELGGKLTALNTVSSHGDGPCHVSIDRTGKFVLVANYGGGSIAVLPIRADGSLGEATAAIQHAGSSVNKGRQREPHGHSIYASADNKFVIAADLGIDKLMVYKFDAQKGTLTPNDPPAASLKPGSGPRHFAFHPKGKFAYSANELFSNVTAFDWDAAKGTLTEKQTISTLPEGFTGNNSDAEIEVHPNGKFLYASNRGHDSVAVFSIASDGTLKMVEAAPLGVKTPRHFAIAPGGTYLFAEGQDSNNFTLLKLDPKTGKLTGTGQKFELGSPVCIVFAPVL